MAIERAKLVGDGWILEFDATNSRLCNLCQSVIKDILWKQYDLSSNWTLSKVEGVHPPEFQYCHNHYKFSANQLQDVVAKNQCPLCQHILDTYDEELGRGLGICTLIVSLADVEEQHDEQPDFRTTFLVEWPQDCENDEISAQTSICHLQFTVSTASGDWTEIGHGLSSHDRKHALPISLDIPKDSGSAECFETVAAWLKACCESHPNCARTADVRLPSRLIEVSPSCNDDDRIVLRETTGRFGSYVALSYCWGDNTTLKTTRGNIKSHMESIPLHQLPGTLFDAVMITRSLKIKYLWIDCLCIVQNDPTDWEAEAPTMHQVYGNALLTISATSSDSSQSGIWENRSIDRRRIDIDCVRASRKGIPRGIMLRRKEYDPFREDGKYHSINGPVEHRAWTLQEKFMAPAVLHYTEEGMIWECKSFAITEYGHMTQLDSFWKTFNIASDPDLSVHDFWHRLVTNFTRRSLTYKSDALMAIGGLARVLQRKTPSDRYLAGMWLNDLPFGLLWMCQQKMSETREGLPDRVLWRAPSWSWASVNTIVTYSECRKRAVDEKSDEGTEAKVVEATVDMIGKQDAYSQVTCGKLILQGIVQETLFKRRYPSDDNYGWYGKAYDNILVDDGIDCFMDLVLPDGSPLVCIEIGTQRYKGGRITTNFLFVQSSHEDAKTFQRVGIGIWYWKRPNGRHEPALTSENPDDIATRPAVFFANGRLKDIAIV